MQRENARNLKILCKGIYFVMNILYREKFYEGNIVGNSVKGYKGIFLKQIKEMNYASRSKARNCAFVSILCVTIRYEKCDMRHSFPVPPLTLASLPTTMGSAIWDIVSLCPHSNTGRHYPLYEVRLEIKFSCTSVNLDVTSHHCGKFYLRYNFPVSPFQSWESLLVMGSATLDTVSLCLRFNNAIILVSLATTMRSRTWNTFALYLRFDHTITLTSLSTAESATWDTVSLSLRFDPALFLASLFTVKNKRIRRALS